MKAHFPALLCSGTGSLAVSCRLWDVPKEMSLAGGRVSCDGRVWVSREEGVPASMWLKGALISGLLCISNPILLIQYGET